MQKLTQSLSTVHRLLECPVCLEMVRAPVKRCGRCHVTCTPCGNKSAACSLCAQAFLEEPPTFINNLLEALPRPCRYTDTGCKVICDSEDEHELFCGFRPVPCPLSSCKEEVPVCQVQDHYEREHPNKYVLKKMEETLITKNSLLDLNYSRKIPAFLDGNFFCVTHRNKKNENVLKFHAEAFFVKKPNLEYLLTIKLEKGNVLCGKTIKLIVEKGGCKSSEEVEAKENAEEFCMKVPHAFLSDFTDDNNILRYSLCFFKR